MIAANHFLSASYPLEAESLVIAFSVRLSRQTQREFG